jgi:thiol:disulfide interchange protein/DsbC/DsbD-like thiol-disulfide interchange protein
MLKIFRVLLLLLVLCPAGRLAAQEYEGKQLTERVLLADTSAVEAGKPFYVGFHFKIEEGWHSYWEWPGSVGLPLSVTWEVPAGFTAGPLEFSVPKKVIDQYGQTFFGYEHEVMYLAKITPPAQLPAGEVKLVAKMVWQVCKESCLRAEDAKELKLSAGPAQPANAELFAKWKGELPKTTAPPTKDVKLEASGKQMTIRVAGVPGEDKVEVFPVPPTGNTNTLEFGAKLSAESAGGAHTFQFPFENPITPAGWRTLLVVQKAGSPREGWVVEPTVTAASAAPAAAGGLQQQVGENYGLLLLFGFIGGLILNLMPCVLPVIGLKILGFVSQAGNDRGRIFKLGLAFCGGVFAFFYTLALATIPLKAAGVTLTVGWQFQNPYLLVGMLALFLCFAMSLLGVFEIELSGGVSDKISEAAQKKGLGGAFVHGFFTTLMGFSCTAPFAAAPLGVALSQPGLQAFGLFTAVAAGLCLPYFLLTLNPKLMRFLPKPGTWMVRFKQIMGFVLLLFVLFFFSSMISRGKDAAMNTLYFLLVVGIACWLLGIMHERQSRWLIAVALLIGGWFGLVHGSLQRSTDEIWQPYSEKRLTEALKAGQPVFVDFTAEWCVNCKFFERTVLARENIQSAFKEKKVLLLKGDITDEASPEGREAVEALRKFNRAGVPFYVLFRKENDTWFDDKLTQGSLLEELNKL